jgi:hypothetical protein
MLPFFPPLFFLGPEASLSRSTAMYFPISLEKAAPLISYHRSVKKGVHVPSSPTSICSREPTLESTQKRRGKKTSSSEAFFYLLFPICSRQGSKESAGIPMVESACDTCSSNIINLLTSRRAGM